MEVRELLQAARHIRPWALLIFSVIAFQSLKNAQPPELTEKDSAQVVLVATR